MAVEIKNIQELLDEAMLAILEEGGPVTDFTPGSTTYTFIRAMMSVLATGYKNLDEALSNSFIATATGIALDSHVSSFGVFRKQGTLASGALVARPRVVGATGNIVAGITRFRTADGTLEYVATQNQVLQAPYTLVPVTATQIGQKYDLPPTTELLDVTNTLNAGWTFVVGSDGLDLAGNPTGFLRGGSDREDDETLKARFVEFVNSLSRSTYRAVRQAVLSVEDVQSAVLLEYTPAVGWFTVYIDDGTDELPQALLDRVTETLEETKALGIGYEVYAMPKTFVPITVQVKIDPTFSAASITAAVKEEIEALMNTYTFGQSLYISKIMDAAHNVPGVLRATVFQPATDVIVDPQEIVRAGLITVSAVL